MNQTVLPIRTTVSFVRLRPGCIAHQIDLSLPAATDGFDHLPIAVSFRLCHVRNSLRCHSFAIRGMSASFGLLPLSVSPIIQPSVVVCPPTLVRKTALKEAHDPSRAWSRIAISRL